MPLYDYECRSCGQVFEVMQKFSDSPLEVHEGCGGPVSRLLSAPALQFKGSGWYITDYARSGGGEKKTASSEEKTGSDSSKKSADSTPAASTASTTSTKKD
ncbi:MAG: zinc ribbon domain-containing protein [Acidimicrobiia bacterium]|nr:zinc ribbon domain-containing protein [Acidimicrobiia bacterium]